MRQAWHLRWSSICSTTRRVLGQTHNVRCSSRRSWRAHRLYKPPILGRRRSQMLSLDVSPIAPNNPAKSAPCGRRMSCRRWRELSRTAFDRVSSNSILGHNLNGTCCITPSCAPSDRSFTRALALWKKRRTLSGYSPGISTSCSFRRIAVAIRISMGRQNGSRKRTATGSGTLSPLSLSGNYQSSMNIRSDTGPVSCF